MTTGAGTELTWQLEVVVVPVADVDRAKQFYQQGLGFALDVDHRAGDLRVVQLTPPGSACSIIVGTGVGGGEPGSVKGLYLVVQDIEAACAELRGRGVEVTPARHMTAEGWADGADPAHQDYNSFADLSDPDGNQWMLQERGHRART